MRLGLLAAASLLVVCGCGKPCDRDDQCPLPAVCAADHRCAAPAPGPDGSTCSHDLHCQGGACVFGAEGGRCATACESQSDCPSAKCAPVADQRSGASTLRLVCGAAGGDRYTAETCRDDAECRSGLCDDGHCTSPCGTCPAAFSCRPRTLSRGGLSLDHGACTWWPVQPTLELGAVDTDAVTGGSVGFMLPPGYAAFTLVLEDAADQVPTVLKLVGPDGTLFIGAPRTADGGSTDVARASPGPGTTTVLVPGSDDPRAVPPPGHYQLELVTYDPVGYPLTQRQVAGHVDRVAVVLKRPARGGLVDLTLHLAPESGLGVADGGGDAFVRGMLSRFEQVTRDKLGVALGQVRLLTLPEDAGVSVTTLAESRGLWSAYSVGAPTTRPINVMVVADLSFAGGVAGTSPGPPGIYGRPTSGITLAPLGSGPTSTGVLLAHEVIHYLGLFHTSDSYFGPDLISDTPACADPSGAGCPDERNLKFPYFPTREPLTLTLGQEKVLEGSPWLYQWVHPGACGTEADVIGLTAVGYASGTTRGAPARLTGGCGGAGGEAVHLLRLDAAAKKLEATVTATDFTPALYLRRTECGPAGQELACAVADGGVTTVAVDNPAAGAWFVVVDSAADGGTYAVSVTVTH